MSLLTCIPALSPPSLDSLGRGDCWEGARSMQEQNLDVESNRPTADLSRRDTLGVFGGVLGAFLISPLLPGCRGSSSSGTGDLGTAKNQILFVPGFMSAQQTELRLPPWVSELTAGQAARFEPPSRSSTKAGGLAARHSASLEKWRARLGAKL